jgi:phosphoribosyl-ATP pyrophosphohydrolase
MSTDVLNRLSGIIKARRDAKPEVSYTKRLLDGGPIEPAKKLGEEAVETAIAALAQDDEALIGEAADLIYHLLVVLEYRGVAFEAVLDELDRRMGLSGLQDKKRKSG